MAPRDLKIPEQRHPEKARRPDSPQPKKPDWIRVKAPGGKGYAETARIMREKLQGTGYTTDQTDAWVCLEISGPETILALERLCPLDIARFTDGTAARTVMQHMGALIIRLSADRFLLLSARSSAASFLQAVETSYRNVT